MEKNPQSDVALAIAAQVLLGKEARGSNAALSPVSIQAMLSLIAAGAAKGPALDRLLSFLKAESIEELNSIFSMLVSDVLSNSPEDDGDLSLLEEFSSIFPQLDSSSDEGAKVSFANGIWADKSLPPLTRSFKRVASNVYKADSRRVDFKNQAGKVVDEVNEWAKQHTNGVIKQVLSPSDLTASTGLVLANALYFKGAWARKYFDPKTTKFRDFHLMNGTRTVQVPFMTSKANQYIGQFDGFKVLSLPYRRGKGRDFSMRIFLPDSTTGLHALVQKMGSKSGFVDRHRPRKEVEVGEFWIPKFKISFGFEASDVLKEMGLALDGVELSGMVEEEEECGGVPLRVSSVIHKAFVEVNEEGTEAAALNLFECQWSLSSPKKLKKMDFVAEHPFVFLIRDDLTGTVLFVGQVLDPSGETEGVSRTKRKLNPEVGDQEKMKKRKKNKNKNKKKKNRGDNHN